MNPISGNTAAADLVPILVGGAAQQQSDLAVKMVKVEVAQQVQSAKADGLGVVLDAVA